VGRRRRWNLSGSPVSCQPWKRPAAWQIWLTGAVIGGLLIAVAAIAARWLDRVPPTDANLLAMGLTAAEWGDHRTARRAASELVGRGHHEEAALVRAKILISKGFTQPATDSLGDVHSAALETPRQLLMAEAAQRAGDHREVEAILTPMVIRQPDLLDAHRLLAASYYDLGAVDGAVTHLHEAARLAPSDPRPMRLLGLIHSDYELFDEAIPFYIESLRRGPDQPDREDVLLELARCQTKQRQHEEALTTLTRRRPSAESELVRAECLLALGRRDEARAVVARVLDARPDDVEALLLEGTIRLEDGDADAAMAFLKKAASSDPNHYLAHLTLAKALSQVGRETDAEAERATAERIREARKTFADLHKEAWENPQDPAVRLRLAELAARLGRPDLEAVWRAAAASLTAGEDGSPRSGDSSGS
jgi:tetratricopeptide (TPR) repeat protein